MAQDEFPEKEEANKSPDEPLPLSYSSGTEEDGPGRYRVGTLVYTKLGLVAIFGWMIWGTLCFNLFEAVGGPEILKLYLQDSFHVSNLKVSILFNFIPMAIGTVMTPIISFRSDRTRSRLGRRIPYILYTAPFLVLFAIGLGFSDDIVSWCKLSFTTNSFVSPFTAALIIIGFLTVGFSLFNEFVGTVFYYLLPDVMPVNFIGRFTAVSQIFGFGASIAINYYITPQKLTHIKAIHVGVALLYFVGLGMVCLRVKEGQYPPVEDVTERTKLADKVKMYFRECFCHPIFILFYISTAVTMLARGLNPAGVFSLHLSEHQSTAAAQKGPANAVAMSANGKLTVAGGDDGTVKIWDTSKLRSPSLLKTLDCQVAHVTCIGLTADDQIAVIGGSNGAIETWNVKTGHVIQSISAHPGGVLGLAIAPDAKTFASCGADKLAAIWDIDTGQRLQTLAGHTDAINCIAFGTTGNYVATGSSDKSIIIWNPHSGKQIKTLQGSPGPVYTVAFMPVLTSAPPPPNAPHGIIAQSTYSASHFLHNVFTNESLYDPANPPTSAVGTPDAWVISGGRDGAKDQDYALVRIWDVSSGTTIKTMKGHKRAVTSVLYKPDLHLVLSGSQDESIRVWMPMDLSSTADDQSYKTFSGYTHAITSIACATTGVGLVDASTDGKAQFWDIDQGVSLAKGGLQAIFFAILGIILVYPIGSFVDRHNPLRITIIATVLGLPIILSYFFFLHSYLYGFWAGVVNLPLGMLVTVANVPMLVLLYPKSKYGQFASANALVRQAVGALFGVVGAIIMDRLTANSLNTDNYRYGYIFQFAVHTLSMLALVGVYIYWKNLGGPNYVAPESVSHEPDLEFEPENPAETIVG